MRKWEGIQLVLIIVENTDNIESWTERYEFRDPSAAATDHVLNADKKVTISEKDSLERSIRMYALHYIR